MKYGAIPTNLLERFALLAGKVPIPVIDALFGPMKSRAIMAGVSLGVFEAMRGGRHRASDLAATLRLDATALELLLRTLVVCDYVVQHGAEFALSPMARRTVLTGGTQELVGYLRFNYAQWRFIGELETLVRTGQGIDFHQTMTDPGEWRDYQQGMLEIARLDAPLLASRVPVPKGATQLLDVAGSHGLYGAAICRRHPPMRSTVIELPQAVAHARALASAEGIGALVSHREGDLLTADLGGDQDVVLLSNILHHFTPQTIASILARVGAATRAGGTVAIWEIEAPRSGSRATVGDATALYFRLTSTAGAFHGDDYATWLRHAGYVDIHIARPVLSPGSVMVTGVRGEERREKK